MHPNKHTSLRQLRINAKPISLSHLTSLDFHHGTLGHSGSHLRADFNHFIGLA